MYKVLIWGLLSGLGSPKIPAWSQQSMPPATPQREQSPPSAESSIEIQNYAPYNIALLPDKTGAEIVLPFMTVENRLAFFTLSQVQQASKDKKLLGRLISYGELISLIGDLQVQVNQLKQENDKLWAVVWQEFNPSDRHRSAILTPSFVVAKRRSFKICAVTTALPHRTAVSAPNAPTSQQWRDLHN